MILPPMAPFASSRAGRLAGLAGALCVLLTGSLASAEGIDAGDLAKEGYKLPGGFEPVLHLRTFYYDQVDLAGKPSEAWALGGWAGVRSPWWGDLFQLGIVGYASLKLYGPLDKDGTKLLAPGQESIVVLGEVFGAVRLLGQTATAGRQLIDRPFIDPHDVRMVPATFEAYTVKGSVDTMSYTGGYITKKKNRESENFVWMSEIAGGTGEHKGLVYAGGTWNFARNGYVRMDEQYGVDTFNTFYVDGKVPIAIDDKTALTLAAQYYPQTSVGAQQIGSFSTYGLGLQAVIANGPVTAQLSFAQTGKGYDTQSPFGDHVSYLASQMLDFNTAGERAWGLRVRVSFATLGAPGLTALVQHNAGSQRVNSTNGSALPNRGETDFRADYLFGKGTGLEGLVATLRYAVMTQDGSPQSQKNLRAILNYEVKF